MSELVITFCRAMVDSDGEYLPLNYLNDLASAVPVQNRLRRMERCELMHEKTTEVHCIRIDVLLGCAAYLTPTAKRDMISTVGRSYGYMILGKKKLNVA